MSSSRQGRASNFAHTCNLLSQYIKEKGSLKDLNLEIDGRVENLEALVKNGSSNPMLASATTINGLRKRKTADSVQDASHEHTSKDAAAAAAAETDSTAGPLTIFYSGSVLVFDDYPKSKAKELMALAKKGSSQISYGISSNTLPPTPSAPYSCPPPPQQKPESRRTTKGVSISANTADPQSIASSSKGELPIPQQIEASNSGLQIARRSSIHKFLEKRKDRAGARGPYNRVQDNQPSSSRGEENLDLKL